MQDNIFEMKSVIFVEKFDRTKIGSQMRMMHHVEHENWVICDMGEKRTWKTLLENIASKPVYLKIVSRLR